MVETLLALAKKLAVKIATDLVMEPEKALRIVLVLAFIVLIVPMLLFALPITLTTHIPVLLLGSDKDNPNIDLQKQLDTIAIYQTVPININEDTQLWLSDMKKKYSDYDDIKVEFQFDLNWQMLMAIDAVRYNQDFNNINSRDVIKLGNQFIIRTTKTETYKGKEKYYETEYDEQGNPTLVQKERTVNKKRAILTVKTKSFEDVLIALDFDETQTKAAINIYNTIYAADIEGNLNIYDDLDLDELQKYPPGNANIIYFHQADKRWGNSSYGTSTIKSAGCGPTSLAMVIYSLNNRKDVNPEVIANWSVRNGHRSEGSGSYWSLIPAGGKYYGLNVTSVSRKNPKKIVEALSDGYPIIVAMGRGHFTKSGHFIVLRGITDDGKVLVNDPASVNRTKQEWDLAIILNESSTNGGMNGSPFWILKP
jgi:hypothetical protein